MKKLAPGLLAGTAALAVSVLSVLQPAQADPTSADSHEPVGAISEHRPDNRPGPFTEREQKLRQKALAMVENGTAKMVRRSDGGATVKIGEDTWVEFPVKKQDRILTMLSQFGDGVVGDYGDEPGPERNAIPKPDRAVNNSTAWVQDFDTAYYNELFNGSGESMKDYYSKLSSGRYTVKNVVEDWVTIPNNASAYGDNEIEDNGGSWNFVADTGNAWYAEQRKQGLTTAQIDGYLAQFDAWDRYDFDEDGDFNEPDGYIDHFQAVHAGEGEDAGGGAQGEDAIWSHRWYVRGNLEGELGPNVNGRKNLAGGTRIGNSKYFIGDYTVEPENGGLGVFAHEFGHDLGLPDYYDTGGGENSTAFWTLMSSGSWLNHGPDDIGSTPGLMGPEEKLYLGWLDYSEVDAGEDGTFKLSPSQHTAEGADQAVKVNLPDVTTTTKYTKAYRGKKAWWSTRGDNLKSTMTRAVPKSKEVFIKAKIWNQIEEGYDFLYIERSVDGGTTWKKIGQPITGDSKGWKTKYFHYKFNGGKRKSLLRFRYDTDGGVNEAGAFIDEISIRAGGTRFTDGAEQGRNGWTLRKVKASTGTETLTTPRYYLLENRQYVGYDATLETGPYQFSEGITRPDWVERFPFQNGMLVWYVNHAYPDNNVSAHPGAGNAMVVDARPNSMAYPDGSRPSNRRQPFDSTFGLDATDAVCLHKQVATDGGHETVEACAPSSPAIATFDDTDPNAYYWDGNPQGSVKVAGLGVTATVTAQDGNFITVQVHNPAH
ncbi:immune inhibitor A domain-containing protein [Nocardioides speluncae]|uniref:immune inhibitor A domain-containing protein n=1 Tax=Nocardioides speluncae TaxID=2670337 RepID=UPI000D692B17|nr:immune inhibitor A domain-containing protein [Nocardioides speluncae]